MSEQPPNPLAPDADDTHNQQELEHSDAGLARVTEDLIDILIQRGVIQFTDFPAAAQAKLLQRRQTRAALSKRLQLLDDDQETL